MKYLWNKDTNRDSDKRILRYIVKCLNHNISDEHIEEFLSKGIETENTYYRLGKCCFTVKQINGHSTISVHMYHTDELVNIVLEGAARIFGLSLVEDF